MSFDDGPGLGSQRRPKPTQPTIQYPWKLTQQNLVYSALATVCGTLQQVQIALSRHCQTCDLRNQAMLRTGLTALTSEESRVRGSQRNETAHNFEKSARLSC